MACMSPFTKKLNFEMGKDKWSETVHLPCGKCPACKERRVKEWAFRLMKEAEASFSSHFVTLTFDSKNVPLTPKGRMTLVDKIDKVENGKVKKVLDERSVSAFIKRLRYHETGSAKSSIKYYAAGEYGSKTKRPHYHLILFNVKDIENIRRSWTYGSIHIDKCTPASAAYTCKYIDKETRIPAYPGDDRLPEYSRMSKGIGKNFLTDAIKNYYRADLTRNYVTLRGGVKIPLPRYYRKKIFPEGDPITVQSLLVNRKHIEKCIDENRDKLERQFNATYGHRDDYTFEQYLYNLKIGKHNLFYNKNNRDEI